MKNPDRRLKVRVHFNRCNMQRGLPKVWTVHTSRACYQVERVQINVPLEAVFRPEARQPRAFFTGYAHVRVRGNTAELN